MVRNYKHIDDMLAYSPRHKQQQHNSWVEIRGELNVGWTAVKGELEVCARPGVF